MFTVEVDRPTPASSKEGSPQYVSLDDSGGPHVHEPIIGKVDRRERSVLGRRLSYLGLARRTPYSVD